MSTDQMLFTVRRATPDDVDECHVARTESIRHDAAAAYNADQLHAWVDAFNPDAFVEKTETEEMYVATLHDDWVVAYVSLAPETSEVTSFYVGPSGQGMGIEGHLLEHIEKVAREQGLERIWLDSLLNTTRLYADHGWEEVERHHRTRHGVEIPVVKMEKTLS
jgi:putative acetyltransferase